MSASSTIAVDGHAPIASRPQPAKAKDLAQRGVTNVSEIAALSGAMMTGALLGEIGSREGNLAVRSGNLAVRAAEHLVKNGNTALAVADPT